MLDKSSLRPPSKIYRKYKMSSSFLTEDENLRMLFVFIAALKYPEHKSQSISSFRHNHFAPPFWIKVLFPPPNSILLALSLSENSLMFDIWTMQTYPLYYYHFGKSCHKMHMKIFCTFFRHIYFSK